MYFGLVLRSIFYDFYLSNERKPLYPTDDDGTEIAAGSVNLGYVATSLVDGKGSNGHGVICVSVFSPYCVLNFSKHA